MLAVSNAEATYYRYAKTEPTTGLLPNDESLAAGSTYNTTNSFKLTVYVVYQNNKTISVSEVMTNWIPQY